MPLTSEELARVQLNQQEYERNREKLEKELKDARNARRRDRYSNNKIRKQFHEEYPDGIDGLWVSVTRQDRHVPPQKKPKTLENDSNGRKLNGADGIDGLWVSVTGQDRHVPPQKKPKTIENDSNGRELNGADGADGGCVNARPQSDDKPRMKRQNAKAWPLSK